MARKFAKKNKKRTSVLSEISHFSTARQLNFAETSTTSVTFGSNTNIYKVSWLQNLAETADRYSKTILSDIQTLIDPMLNDSNPILVQNFNSLQKEVQFKFNILTDLIGNVQSEMADLVQNRDHLYEINKKLVERLRSVISPKQSDYTDRSIQVDCNKSNVKEPGKMLKVSDVHTNSEVKDLLVLTKNKLNIQTQTDTRQDELDYSKIPDTPVEDEIISLPKYISDLCSTTTPNHDITDVTK